MSDADPRRPESPRTRPAAAPPLPEAAVEPHAPDDGIDPQAPDGGIDPQACDGATDPQASDGAGGAESLSLVATLRRLIIDGRYPAGARLAEIPVAQALGVSRTPVRLAFRTLEQEGLLERSGKRGFAVRAFTEADVMCALEVRGVLEGLAARRLAERGLSPTVDAALQAGLAAGRAVLAKGHLVEDDIGRWSRLNEAFHRAIVEAAGSRVVVDAIARNNHLPFASADSLVIDRHALAAEFRKLQLAQMQHQLIVEALRQRESARVESLMREHAYIALRYGALFGVEVHIGLPGQDAAA